jgi:hypothetical protein
VVKVQVFYLNHPNLILLASMDFTKFLNINLKNTSAWSFNGSNYKVPT